MKTTVTILVDNSAAQPGLATEHGLSMWIETENKRVLFDTGQGYALPINAAALDVDLSQTNTIVLSHGHYDHTGGLCHLLKNPVIPPIYVSPQAHRQRYACRPDEPARSIGMPQDVADALLAGAGAIVFTERMAQITDHLWLTGPIPRPNTFEDTGGPFFLDAEGTVPDLLEDDQALWLDTSDGIVVLLGCAHSGVVNTLDYIARITGCKRFHAVIGGMHLVNANDKRLEKTAEALDAYGVQIIAPCHCTGEAAMNFLRSRFPDKFVSAAAGSTFFFNTDS